MSYYPEDELDRVLAAIDKLRRTNAATSRSSAGRYQNGAVTFSFMIEPSAHAKNNGAVMSREVSRALADWLEEAARDWRDGLEFSDNALDVADSVLGGFDG